MARDLAHVDHSGLMVHEARGDRVVGVALGDGEGDGRAAQARLVDDDVVAQRGAPAIEHVLDADVDEAGDLGVEGGAEEHEEAAAALEEAIELDGVGLGQRPLGAGEHGDVAVGGHAAVERDGARRLVIAAQLLGEVAVGVGVEAVDGRLAVAGDEADVGRALVGDGEEAESSACSPFHAFIGGGRARRRRRRRSRSRRARCA